jgi:hypothetical protein
MSQKRVRRTAEEIRAGFPHELKKKGVNFKTWLKEQKTKGKNATKKKTRPLKSNGYYENSEDVRVKRVFKIAPPPKYSDPPKRAEKEAKTEYIKVVEKVIVKTKNNSEELHRIMQAALENCVWEWKYVPLDEKFKIEQLDKLGKQGWKLAFIHDNRLLHPKSEKPDILCFQRPKLK